MVLWSSEVTTCSFSQYSLKALEIASLHLSSHDSGDDTDDDDRGNEGGSGGDNDGDYDNDEDGDDDYHNDVQDDDDDDYGWEAVDIVTVNPFQDDSCMRYAIIKLKDLSVTYW